MNEKERKDLEEFADELNKMKKEAEDFREEEITFEKRKEESENLSIANEVLGWKRKPTEQELNMIRMARIFERNKLTKYAKMKINNFKQIYDDLNFVNIKNFAITSFCFFMWLAYGNKENLFEYVSRKRKELFKKKNGKIFFNKNFKLTT